MPKRGRQVDERHPEPWESDLNPQKHEGQRAGAIVPDERPDYPTAADIPDAAESLPDFRKDELREIPVVPAGHRLEQGRTYLDLRDPNREPFRATAQMRVEAYHAFVPKEQTPYPYWNRLIGLTDPRRTT